MGIWTRIFATIGLMVGGTWLGRTLFGGAQARADEPAPVSPVAAMDDASPTVQGQRQQEVRMSQAPAALTYDRLQQDTQWLDPRVYEGRIHVPESVIADAKARGERGVYGLVAVDAGYRLGKDGQRQPYVRGFHVFCDLENDNRITLIPMMSGGMSPISATDFSDARAVESSINAPLPGLLHAHDLASAGALDGVHRVGAIEHWDGHHPYQFFLLLDDGLEHRSDLGVHVDKIETQLGEVAGEAPWGSLGCPMIPAQYEAYYRTMLERLGIDVGDRYYVLASENVAAIAQHMQSAGVQESAQTGRGTFPPRPTPEMQRA